MKKFFTLLTLALTTIFSQAQPDTAYKYYATQGARFLDTNGDTLINALAGGIHSPQFCEIELNGDTHMDLLIFDRLGNKISTFINNGTPNFIDYSYAPEYEDKFPKLRNWVITRDYDRDGKMDIFTSSNDRNLFIYRNTSSGGVVSFEQITNNLTGDAVRSHRPGFSPPFDSIFIFISGRNYPAIEDVDGDGDLDILSFPTFGDAVDLYLNRQEDANLPKDKLAFSQVDLCWGSFGENLSTGNINLAFCTWWPQNVKFYKKKKHDSGGTLTLYDVDGDGDQDLFHGTLDIAGVKYLENGKADYNYPYDTMISYSSDYPFGGKKVDLYHFVNTFFMDVNNDDLNDMVVTVNGVYGVDETNQVWWYKNVGTNLIPDFKFENKNLLQNTMLDFGGRTAPVLWDYDNDEDYDLLIGSNGDFAITSNNADRLYLYENVGTNEYPIYKQVSNDFLSLSVDDLSFTSPTLGDINADGKKDLLIGMADGTIRYYKNTSTTGLPTFVLEDAKLQNIDVGDNAAPFIYDMDEDGRHDLIVGTKGGNIHYYRNTGSNITPAYQYVTDSLGKVKINEYKADVNPPIYVDSGYSVPVVADLDYDGKYELIVGGMEGKVRIFNGYDPTDLTKPFHEVDSFLYNSTADTFLGSIKVGTMVYPAVGEINNDSMLDIFIGNTRGGLILWESKNTLSPLPNHVKETDLAKYNLKLYPNPANNNITLSRDINDATFDIEVITTLGKVVKTDSFKAGDYKYNMNISDLNPGIYFVRIRGDLNANKIIKFTVLR